MSEFSRRSALKLLVAGSAGSACSKTASKPAPKKVESAEPAADLVLQTQALPPGASPWPTPDPFLFCVHHNDLYPKGNERLGPAASLSGRQMGRDFAGKDGWNMYHGEVVPGFPRHPHRGFETVTVVRRGLLDHSDSMGAAARYGQGDVQWLTAGAGIQHAEMFPLLRADEDNPVELFQIWLNLPKATKMVEPHFSMLWSPTIPKKKFQDSAGRAIEVTITAGQLGDMRAPSPPPNSWASQKGSHVAIWTIKLAPDAEWQMPAAASGLNRWLYFFRGQELLIGQRPMPVGNVAELRSDASVQLQNGSRETELLLLQGQPLNEPVVKAGPFVMNTREEIQRAWQDYRRSGFGGWPWQGSDPVHGREQERFARHADGRLERPV